MSLAVMTTMGTPYAPSSAPDSIEHHRTAGRTGGSKLFFPVPHVTGLLGAKPAQSASDLPIEIVSLCPGGKAERSDP